MTMRKLPVLFFLALLATLAVIVVPPFCNRPVDTPVKASVKYGQFGHTGGTILIPFEAEELLLYGSMVPVVDTLASNGNAVSTGVGTEDGSTASVGLTVPNGGLYYLWVRGKATHQSSDAIKITVDCEATELLEIAGEKREHSPLYKWRRAVSLNQVPKMFPLATGIHVLMFGNLEPDVTLDSFIFVNDPLFVPTS